MTLIPPYFNLFDYFLGEERLARIGRRTAIEFCGSHITYDELRREVDYWTGQIISCGVAEGDRVALLLYDSPEFIASFLAAVSIGGICVPINTFLSPEEVQFIISDSGAQLVIAEDGLWGRVRSSSSMSLNGCAVIVVDGGARPYLEPKSDRMTRPSLASTVSESPAFMLYTSGSTGTPKGALHKHGAIAYAVESYARTILQLNESDRTYSASRLFFAYGLGNSLSFPLSAGARVILDPGRPTAQHLARILAEAAPTVFFGVPAVFRLLLELNAQGTRVDASSLRLCVSAGEALPARVFEDWREEFGQTILDGIGSTEMLHIFISNRLGDARAGSSGRTVEGYEARLIDDEGKELFGEQTGNLWVRGASASLGYWNRPELTAQTMREGWVRTGDIYRRNADEYFYHIGRSDDCFKVRGLWVSPVEVESALLSHEAVADAAVVSDVDGSGLATAHAYVVIRKDRASEALEEKLRDHVKARLAQHKAPSRIDFVEELPRTATGKIQRYKLRRGREHTD